MKLLCLIVCAFLAVDARPQAHYKAALKPTFNFQPFIIGGDVIGKGRWPWQLSLEFYNLIAWSHICGAALISPTRAVTAGHCIIENDATYFRVKTGMSVISKADMEETILVKSIVVHKDFNQDAPGIPNDIAILNLETPAKLSENVKAAPLPAQGEAMPGSTCYISGWGKTSGGILDPPSDELREAKVDALTHAECVAAMAEGLKENVLKTHQCVHDKVGKGKGACQGDSGGPLQCESGGAYKLAGVTSWGVGSLIDMCMTEYPSIYTKVSDYLDFINQ